MGSSPAAVICSEGTFREKPVQTVRLVKGPSALPFDQIKMRLPPRT
jgi:hypothetical protein